MLSVLRSARYPWSGVVCVVRAAKQSFSMSVRSLSSSSRPHLTVSQPHSEIKTSFKAEEQGVACKEVCWSEGRFLYLNHLPGYRGSLPLKINHFFLRDNCSCEESYNSTSQQRIHDTCAIDVDVYPLSAVWEGGDGTENDEGSLKVNWSDGRNSAYSAEWLRYLFQTDESVRPICWLGKDMINQFNLIRFDHKEVLENDSLLKQAYVALAQYGFVHFTNSERTPEAAKKMAQRLGSIMHSREYYGGSSHYEISNTNNHEDFDIAYTNVGLPLHSDNSDMHEPAGLVMLQIIKHTGTGGQSTLVDAFKVVNILKEYHEEAYKILSTYPITHHVNKIYKWTGSIIENHRFTNELMRIRYNTLNRCNQQLWISQDYVEEWYAALNLMTKIIESKDILMKFKLEADTMMVFDNWRMLHGRTSFTGDRSIIGCYVPYSEWKAKARSYGIQLSE